MYYCVDEWSMFGYLDRDKTVAQERELLAQGRRGVRDQPRARRGEARAQPETFVSPHGVDHALFAKRTRPRDGGARRPRGGPASAPRLLRHAARLGRFRADRARRAHPPVVADRPDRPAARGVLARSADLPNVHLLGQKKHDELPAYCKGFDVGMIPYRIDERMTFVNPLKLREYLSAGLPVVSTPVPEVRRYARPRADRGDAGGVCRRVRGGAARRWRERTRLRAARR